ncbi:hypothetical protein AB0I39_31915 [Kitasatospora purpeofusca]|uniref:hypothetical protein n=1 Tax=Kitasatospora purpeofusca TaxID=67352 RepID=UPI0033FA89EE
MEIVAGAGYGCGAWPELTADRRPVLLVPAAKARPVLVEDGWDRDPGVLERLPAAGWSALAGAPGLTVRGPDGRVWFDRPVTAGREWWRALRTHEVLLLVTGPFTGVLDLRPAAAAGRLFLLTTPVHTTHGPRDAGTRA